MLYRKELAVSLLSRRMHSVSGKLKVMSMGQKFMLGGREEKR